MWVYGENRGKPVRRLEFDNCVSPPAAINQSILHAIRFPSKFGCDVSTPELFATILESFTSHGFPEEAALPATYFVFPTWFVDCLPTAPCLLIMGPRPEAELLLQLLGCMVRHSLPLRSVTRDGFLSLPMELQLSLLITQEKISPSMWELLCASNYRNANVTRKDGVVNTFCAKAIYRGCGSPECNLDDSMLRINLSPSHGRLPILDGKDTQEIAEELQPKLLAYRRRNIAKVRESQFDLPEFSSGIRILGRVLGAPIVDAPKLQTGFVPLLREYHEEIMAAHWFDFRCVAIEAALFHCHNGQEETIYVGKIACTANAILKGRGETAQLGDKEIGTILRRSLGLFPKRDKKGFAIRLTDRIRRHIHQLAGKFDVATAQAGVAKCLYCAEIVAGGATGIQLGAFPKGK
jgi:hypothetical protein